MATLQGGLIVRGGATLIASTMCTFVVCFSSLIVLCGPRSKRRCIGSLLFPGELFHRRLSSQRFHYHELTELSSYLKVGVSGTLIDCSSISLGLVERTGEVTMVHVAYHFI